MYYSVDKNRRIIFGWSPKSGCSHVKTLFLYLNKLNYSTPQHIHSPSTFHPLPHDIENYTTLIFIRNPYHRIVSGFLDKYKKTGQYRNKWTHPTITFSKFVEELIHHNWNIVDPS